MTDHPLAPLVKTWHTKIYYAIGKLMIEKPEGFTIQDVVDIAYAREPGNDEHKSVSHSLRKVRKRLEPLGWTIPTCRGNRKNSGVYRLVKLP